MNFVDSRYEQTSALARDLWAEYNTRPAALVKKAVGASVELTGSGGPLCTLARSSEPLAVLEIPLLAA